MRTIPRTGTDENASDVSWQRLRAIRSARLYHRDRYASPARFSGAMDVHAETDHA